MKKKTLKYKDDECFKKDYEQIEQCDHCWIKKSCHTAYRNRKDK